jgi:superfamily II DNA or RNA helicase
MEELDKVMSQIERLSRELAELDQRRAQLATQLECARAALATFPQKARTQATTAATLTPQQKVRLFRDLFRGREDVFPVRFERKRDGKSGYSPVCANKFVNGLCALPKVKCGDCQNRAFLPVSNKAIQDHLEGRHTIGVYPMLPDETCWFLAMDFDEATWMDDVGAVRETCERLDIPAYVERSRSGNGAHVWFFFSAPVSASLARLLGSFVITETMSSRPELSFASYDRLFPNQDTMPTGGFGNLIALPLQAGPRKLGNSVFVDRNWTAIAGQWSHLRSILRLQPDRLEGIIRRASQTGTILGVRAVENEEVPAKPPWLKSSSATKAAQPITGPLPNRMKATVAQRVFVEKQGLPPALVGRIRRLAAFQNPEFYKKQALRMSTWDTPRILCCAENLEQHVALPRGCLEGLCNLAALHHIDLSVEDLRIDDQSLDVSFVGKLTSLQQQALDALAQHDTGILVAPPGVGKTVVATALVAQRQCSTLVLVNRRHLLNQWRTELARFLGIGATEVGQFGGGSKSGRNGRLDVAMVQALARTSSLNDAVGQYGQVIIDECHHASSVSFERVLSEVRARHVVGLTATPKRRDGQQAIMEMQLGPIRFEVNPREVAASRPFEHKLIVRETSFRLDATDSELSISEIYAQLLTDSVRNMAILEDVLGTLAEGRHPVVLTQRREHVDWFAERLGRYARTVVVLKGGMGRRAENQVRSALASERANGSTVLVATGPYIGEGFDDAQLDTLLLAMPIAWKGTLAQYVGRLHRLSAGKQEVRVFDYVDRDVPMLARMFAKRQRGYRSLGYAEGELPDKFEMIAEEWSGASAEFDGDVEEDIE